MSKKGVRRVDHPVLPAFAKDEQKEAFLASLNGALQRFEEESYLNREERFPTLHIIGVPRSGTTLLTQLIAAHLNVGYIDNLAAAFWKAPTVGLQLSSMLGPRPRPATYESQFGRTKGIWEPHEFGYFWARMLKYPDLQQRDPSHEESIDWQELARVLTNMTHSISRPIAFKSFLAGFHASRLQKALPKTCFVHIRRDRLDNAVSLVRAREAFLGSRNRWLGVRPLQYPELADLPWWDQVAGQIVFLDREYAKQLQDVPSSNVLTLSYEEVCSDPESALRAVGRLLECQGWPAELRGLVPPAFSVSRGAGYLSAAESTKLVDAFKEFDAQLAEPA